MVVECQSCRRWFEDAYRSTLCPHATFAANDGRNNFAHHPESHLGDSPPGFKCSQCGRVVTTAGQVRRCAQCWSAGRSAAIPAHHRDEDPLAPALSGPLAGAFSALDERSPSVSLAEPPDLADRAGDSEGGDL